MDEKKLDELAKPCWSFDHLSFDYVSFARSVMHAQEQDDSDHLKTCPFCGSEAEILTMPEGDKS